MSMHIGIIGSGTVGTTLARGFANCGHAVTLGTRHPADHQALEPAVHVASFADAARAGEVLLLAVKWSAIDDVLALAGPANFAGKVLIDTSNPLVYRDGRPAAIELPAAGSAAQLLAAVLPETRIVKAFNTVGAGLMVDPDLPGGPPDMFVCGDDEAAKALVARLCADVRYPAYDVGPLARAAELEHLAFLWITIALRGTTGGHAFTLLRRNP